MKNAFQHGFYSHALAWRIYLPTCSYHKSQEKATVGAQAFVSNLVQECDESGYSVWCFFPFLITAVLSFFFLGDILSHLLLLFHLLLFHLLLLFSPLISPPPLSPPLLYLLLPLPPFNPLLHSFIHSSTLLHLLLIGFLLLFHLHCFHS